jgi:hypothetical protein
VIATMVALGALSLGCAAALKYDKVSLGMSPDEVVSVAGAPRSKFRMESTGQGTLVPTPAGASETWFYKSGLIQFHNGKVVAKGASVKEAGR